MPMAPISQGRYRQLTFAALVFLAAIIFTGALVRLTGSGLGCSDWPNCEPGAPVAVRNGHQAIEQINRLFTGVMAIAIMLCLAASLRLRPRRKDLTRLSISLVAGFFLQAVVGGIVVKTHLHPLAVMWHFLLSAIVLVASVVLHQRAAEPTGRSYRPTVPRPIVNHVRVCAALGVLVVVTGTVVTNTGPHGGSYKDEAMRRFGFALTSVTRVHSICVLVLIASLLWLFFAIRRTPAWTVCEDRLNAVFFAVFVQGALGYVQYATKLPVGLVAAHIAGAVAVIVTLSRLVLVTREAVATP